jgi:hypothetical protein
MMRHGADEGSPPRAAFAADGRPADPLASVDRARSLTAIKAIRRARRYARARQGVVAFAVLDRAHRPRGLLRTVQFPSASVSKAMLLVAVLRRAGRGHLSDSERSLLRPMITFSDNDGASAIYGRVGGEGLRRVARAAGMRKFVDVGYWAGARITAADQTRLFLRIDRLVPAWGIAPIARRRHMRIFFKGGWREGITHQVALLERGRRLALAVLTSGSPSMGYAEETIEGIAGRVLG